MTAPTRRAASGGFDTKVVLWDISGDGAPKPVGQPIRAPVFGITALAFTSVGDSLLSAAADGSMILWDVGDLADVQYLVTYGDRGPQFAAAHLAIGPDRSLLVVAAVNGQLRVSSFANLPEARSSALAEQACAISGPLTAEEWSTYVPSLPFEDTCR